MKNLAYAYTLVNGEPPTRCAEIIEHNIRFCKDAGADFFVKKFDVKDGETAIGTSDVMRIYNAATIPQTLYVDWDCKILRLPNFDVNRALTSMWIGDGLKDIWAIYNGVQTPTFLWLYHNVDEQKTKSGKFGDYGKLLNSVQCSDVDFFPDDCFEHVGIHASAFLRKV